MHQPHPQHHTSPAWLRSACLAIVLVGLCAVTPALADTAIMWNIEGGKSNAVLLGWTALPQDKLLPVSEAISKQYEASDRLVVELDLTEKNAVKLASGMLLKAFYPEDDSIFNHLTGEFADELSIALHKIGIDVGRVNRFRPWFLARMMTIYEYKTHGIDAKQGLDSHFSGLARESKPIVALDTVERQLELIDQVPEGQEENYLRRTIGEIGVLRDSLTTLTAAIDKGDIKMLERLTFEPLTKNAALKPIYQNLVFDRNTHLAEQLHQTLQTEGSSLIVLRLRNLLGDQGVLKLLADHGYKVTKR